MKGLRRVLHTQDDALSQQPGFASNLRRLAAYGLSFDLCVKATQLPLARALVAQCPQVQFVLDHCGNPDLQGGRLAAWRADLQALAALPNVVCVGGSWLVPADAMARGDWARLTQLAADTQTLRSTAGR